MAWKSAPRVFQDQTGTEWWSVEEAASRWGVSRRRIYKWINGRVAESKGRYTRKSDGESVQRKGYTARRRLEPGTGYAKIDWFGREIYLIRAGDYPKPIMEPMQRPEGIGQGQHYSHISYEANVTDGYDHVEQPFADPFLSPDAMQPVAASKAAAPAPRPATRPPPPPEETEVEARSEALPEAEIFSYAQQMVQMAVGRYATMMRGDPSQYDINDLRNAIRNRVAAEVGEARKDRSAAIRERASEEEIADLDERIASTTTVNALTDIFGQLVQSVYGSPNFPWTQDPDKKEQVLAAFLEIFRQSGPLDGMRRK